MKQRGERTLEAAVCRAWNAEKSGRLVLAESQARRILREYPGNPDARLIQARVWARTGRIESAIGEFQDLLACDPAFDAARIALIGALFLTNSYSEGIDHLLFITKRCTEPEDAAIPSEKTEAILAALWRSYQSNPGSQEAEILGKDS